MDAASEVIRALPHGKKRRRTVVITVVTTVVGTCHQSSLTPTIVLRQCSGDSRVRRSGELLLGEWLAGGHVAAKGQGDRVEKLEVCRVPVAA